MGGRRALASRRDAAVYDHPIPSRIRAAAWTSSCGCLRHTDRPLEQPLMASAPRLQADRSRLVSGVLQRHDQALLARDRGDAVEPLDRRDAVPIDRLAEP